MLRYKQYLFVNAFFCEEKYRKYFEAPYLYSLLTLFARSLKEEINVNNLTDAAHDADADGIVFEDLTDIRSRISNKGKFQQWSFAYFQEIVTYKARADEL